MTPHTPPPESLALYYAARTDRKRQVRRRLLIEADAVCVASQGRPAGWAP
jgi:hypothetical protein